MTVHYKTEGFVFKKEDRLEADRVFSVFTKDFGRVEVFGKAIRKIASKLKSGIETFYLSEIEFIQGKNKKTLTDAICKENFKNVAQVPEKFEEAVKIISVLDHFIKGEEKDEKIWDLIIDVFKKLDNQELTVSNQQLLYYYFIWNFVVTLGVGPELSRCAVCTQKLNPYGLYFSYKEGGIICKSCSFAKRDGIKIKSDIVKILRLFLKKDWGIISRLKLEYSTQKLLREISDGNCNYLLSTYSVKVI